jgi:hypothetical protein
MFIDDFNSKIVAYLTLQLDKLDTEFKHNGPNLIAGRSLADLTPLFASLESNLNKTSHLADISN